MYIITVRRITSGELLKQRNGLRIARGYGHVSPASSYFGLTPPTEGIAIRTIVGINDDGVFGSRQESWQPDLPDAYAQPFIPVLWLQILELLGRVAKGSTVRFLEAGARPAPGLRAMSEPTVNQIPRKSL